MAADWRRHCTAQDLTAAGDRVEVKFHDGRRHTVVVEELGDRLRLEAIVVRKRHVEESPELSVKAWLRNRRSTLVGFRIDDRRRLIGEAWVPQAGLTTKEFQLYVRSVAAECDRLEFELTGKDEE